MLCTINIADTKREEYHITINFELDGSGAMSLRLDAVATSSIVATDSPFAATAGAATAVPASVPSATGGVPEVLGRLRPRTPRAFLPADLLRAAPAANNNNNNDNSNNNNNDNSNNSIRNHAAAAALNAGGGGVEPSYTPGSSTPRSGSVGNAQVSYSSAGGAATGGTAAVAAAAGGGGDDLYSFEATEGIAGFTAHADDNTIRQSVSQFDFQSQLQLPQQQERTRGSFLLQPNTLVSSSVASSAATSAVVVTIGTNVPSAGVNSGLQSQQPPPPPPSRASLAAALAHTGDGSLSAASWLQPPPPVTPPPPSRNSVPQQQRPEQQKMLTQQLSESYGSESTVSTLQNMYGGSTGLRPQLQAGTWGQERSMPTPTQQQRQAEVLAATAKAAAERHQGPTSAEVAAAFAAYLSGASSAATSAVVVTIGTNVPSAGVNSGLQSQQPPPPPPSRASLAAALAHTGDGSLSTASWLQPPPP
ncbi:hypothetical protein VOLCADRAFT_101057, partial [Volvox carteri f. nagariensis]